MLYYRIVVFTLESHGSQRFPCNNYTCWRCTATPDSDFPDFLLHNCWSPARWSLLADSRSLSWGRAAAPWTAADGPRVFGRLPGVCPRGGPLRTRHRAEQTWARLNRINLPWENFQSIQLGLATFSRTELIQLMPTWLSLASSPWRDDFERDSTIYWTDIFERADSIDRQAVSENDISVSKTEILTKGHLNPREGLQKSRVDSIQLMIQRKTCDYHSTNDSTLSWTHVRNCFHVICSEWPFQGYIYLNGGFLYYKNALFNSIL